MRLVPRAWQICRHANVAMYHIGNDTSAIFSHKSHYIVVLNRVFGNTSCCFVSDSLMQILCLVPYSAQTSDCIKWCVICRPLRNCSDKPLYDVTFACRFLHGKRMTTCELIRVPAVVINCFTDLGLQRILCCTVLHCSNGFIIVYNGSCIM